MTNHCIDLQAAWYFGLVGLFMWIVLITIAIFSVEEVQLNHERIFQCLILFVVIGSLGGALFG